MNRKNLKLILDLALSIMLVFEMFYTLTGNTLHELVGALFFVTLIVHIVLSRTWFKSILTKARSKRSLTTKQKAKMVIGIVLAIACIVLFASSILISNVLGGITGLHLGLAGYNAWAFVHSLFAYILCGACICHVGIHWVGIFSALKIPYNAERRKAINTGVMSVAAIGAVVLGASAAKALDILPNETTQSKDNQFNIPEPAEESISEDTLGSSNDANRSRSRKGVPQKEWYSDQNEASQGRGLDSQSNSANGNNGADSSLPGNSTEKSISNSQSGSSSNESSGSNSSICTLCGKRCSLSSPRCNKPYIAGLI